MIQWLAVLGDVWGNYDISYNLEQNITIEIEPNHEFMARSGLNNCVTYKSDVTKIIPDLENLGLDQHCLHYHAS